MNRSNFALALCVFLLVRPASGLDVLDQGKEFLDSLDTPYEGADVLSVGEIASGLKEALRVGSRRVVKQVGAADGFNRDPAIHIPLPESLQPVQSALSSLGMAGMLDDLELRLNRAAETAAPKAKRLFFDAISEMTLEDANAIYEGSDDAATRYFQGKMSAPLAKEMNPIVTESLASVGAVEAYDDVMGEYGKLPFVPDAKANLTEYVVEKGMSGIFHYLAVEEAAIRNNPVKRTTALLQKVFGS